jgi:ribosomal protein L3 glutamine methyltransferase
VRENELMKFKTVEQALTWAEKEFTQANLYFGHGTDNAWDEAVAILIYLLQLPPNVQRDVLEQELSTEQSSQLLDLFQKRIKHKTPVPYLTQQCWFAGLPFFVDERVLIPRSPMAQLIDNEFRPWVEPKQVKNILDLCTGSACIAIACAHVFLEAHVDASDLSTDALDVAKINVVQHDLQDRVQLYQSDLFSKIPPKKYDIIISNPPYVDAEDMAGLPAEYQHEPELALAAGSDGLLLVHQILKHAKDYLKPDGILVVEVGNSGAALEAAYPHLPLVWLDLGEDTDGVFLLSAADLR